MKQVLVIAGPTASGKTGFSLKAAQQLQGEIISGDSIQVYRGLDIGSGKIRPQEQAGIPHHLIDILTPDQPYSVADFQVRARQEIDSCRGFPILCGGTGLYLKACLYDYDFPPETAAEPADSQLLSFSNEQLYQMLQQQDPRQAEKIHPNNRRRVLRSLSILRRTGVPQSEAESRQNHQMVYDAFIAGCTMPREQLYQRINERVEQMFQAGLQQEVSDLLRQGIRFSDPGMQGIGYREWQDFFAGTASAEAVKEEIQKHSRQFAKRQYTWLNHQMPVRWFNVLDPADCQRIMEEINAWKKPN